jgi:hypothetical protein
MAAADMRLPYKVRQLDEGKSYIPKDCCGVGKAFIHRAFYSLSGLR